MENNIEKPVFIDGYITRDILDTQPLWLLGTGAIHVKKMIAFLQANEKYADKGGWIPFKTVRSKTKDTRYSQIDMYQVNRSRESQVESKEPKYVSHLTSPQEDGKQIDAYNHPFVTDEERKSMDNGDFNLSDIPF